MINPITLCLTLFLVAVFMNLATRNRLAVYYTLFPALLAMGLLMLNNQFAVDQGEYVNMFDRIYIDNWKEDPTNPGYALLNGIVKFLGGDYWTMLLIMNIFALVIIWKLFDRYSPYIAISWFIYFGMYLGYNIALVRQGVAMAFALLAFNYILSKEVWKYLLCITLGFFFHYSIIFFIPAYWIANNISIKRKTSLILLAIAMPFALIDLLGLIFQLAGMLGVPQWQIDIYLSTEGEHYVRSGLSIGVLTRLIFFIGFALAADLENRLQRVLFNLYLVYLLLFFPLSSAGMLATRGLDYYRVFDCLIIPIGIITIRNIYWKIGYILFFIAFYIYTVFNQYAIYLETTKLNSALKNIMDSFSM